MRKSAALRRCRYIKARYVYGMKGMLARVASMLMATALVFACKYLFLPAFQDAALRDARDLIYRKVDDYISGTLDEHFRSITAEDIIKQRFNAENESHSVIINSIYLNRLCTDISKEILTKLTNSDTIAIPVPLSKLLGLGIIYRGGPSIYIKLNPDYSACMSYFTSIADAGEKKTRYQVILKARVHASFGNASIRQAVTVDRQFIICEILY